MENTTLNVVTFVLLVLWAILMGIRIFQTVKASKQSKLHDLYSLAELEGIERLSVERLKESQEAEYARQNYLH